jgi:hypothetical protein
LRVLEVVVFDVPVKTSREIRVAYTVAFLDVHNRREQFVRVNRLLRKSTQFRRHEC